MEEVRFRFGSTAENVRVCADARRGWIPGIQDFLLFLPPVLPSTRIPRALAVGGDRFLLKFPGEPGREGILTATWRRRRTPLRPGSPGTGWRLKEHLNIPCKCWKVWSQCRPFMFVYTSKVCRAGFACSILDGGWPFTDDILTIQIF